MVAGYGQEKTVKAVNSVSDLLSINPTPSDTVYVAEGIQSTDDGSAGILRYYSNNTTPTNAFTVFKPYRANGRWITLISGNSLASGDWWYGYSGTDAEGGTYRGIASTNALATNAINFVTQYFTNYWGAPSAIVAIGSDNFGLNNDLSTWAPTNVNSVAIGYNNFNYSTYTGPTPGDSFFAIGNVNWSGASFNNAYQIWAIGNRNGNGAVTNTYDIFTVGSFGLYASTINDSFRLFFHGANTGQGATITNANSLFMNGSTTAHSATFDGDDNIYGNGHQIFYQATVTRTTDSSGSGDSSWNNTTIIDSYDLFADGYNAGLSSYATNSGYIFHRGADAGSFSTNVNTTYVFNHGAFAGYTTYNIDSFNLYNLDDTTGYGTYNTNASFIFNRGDGTGQSQYNQDSNDLFNDGYAAGNLQTNYSSSFLFHYGDFAGYRAWSSNEVDRFAIGVQTITGSTNYSNQDSYFIGTYAGALSFLTNNLRTTVLGHYSMTNTTLSDGRDNWTIGNWANNNRTLASITNTFELGSFGTVTNSNDFVFGGSAYNYYFPGASTTLEGPWTNHSTAKATVITATKAFRAYQASLTHAGSVNLDFDADNTVASLVLTGNVTFTFSNLATNRTYRVNIRNAQATNCTLSLPSGTQGYFTTTLSNGWHMLSAEAWGTVASNVWVSTSSNGTY